MFHLDKLADTIGNLGPVRALRDGTLHAIPPTASMLTLFQGGVRRMTGEKMDELMIVAISRAAQLAYVEEAHGAFAYLSAADRFFRYHASTDKTATLGEELERLGDLAAIDGSFSINVAPVSGGSGDSGSLFIERLSLIDAALSLASAQGEGPILVEPAVGTAVCVLSRGGERLPVPKA